jgi:myo-inositol 2-dehydrogenase / D-chiro-inositol 1-dehydrogenase
MVGIGLLGAGRIGRLHAGHIAANGDCRLVAIFDEASDAALTLASRYGAQVATSAEELLDLPGIDAVFICSPTDTHVNYIIAAAARGKAIFCEKPIDLDIRRVRDAIAALTKHQVIFTIGFHRRFDPSHRRLRELIQSGELGQIEQVRIVSRDPAPPPISYVRRSGGIFRDMAIHDLDLCRYLVGEEFSEVFAKGDCLIDRAIGDAGDYDTATIFLQSPKGAVCVIQNSRRSPYGFDQRIEVFGSKATGAVENVARTSIALSSLIGRSTDILPQHFPERYAEAYRDQLAHFIRCVRDETPSPTTAFDGLAALTLANAADRSVATGRPITIESEAIDTPETSDKPNA